MVKEKIQISDNMKFLKKMEKTLRKKEKCCYSFILSTSFMPNACIPKRLDFFSNKKMEAAFKKIFCG